jgi:hypothetical protein
MAAFPCCIDRDAADRECRPGVSVISLAARFERSALHCEARDRRGREERDHDLGAIAFACRSGRGSRSL